jgi:hypothetical protein
VKPPNEYIQIPHDESFLPIGPDGQAPLSWSILRLAAEKGWPVVWSMLGLTGIIPANVVADAWRGVENYLALLKVERTQTHIVPPAGFTWGQTTPGEP